AVALVAAGTTAVMAQTQAPETVSPRVLRAAELDAFMSDTAAAPSQARGWPLLEYRYGLRTGNEALQRLAYYDNGVACRTVHGARTGTEALLGLTSYTIGVAGPTADGALGQGVTEAAAAAAAAANETRCEGTVTNNQGATNPALINGAPAPANTTNGNGEGL